MAREIELQASLQHPSIVQIYAAFEDDEGIYVVQEFALGGDLYAQLAQAGGYLAEDQVACEVMVPVLSALNYMHGKVSPFFLRNVNAPPPFPPPGPCPQTRPLPFLPPCLGYMHGKASLCKKSVCCNT